MRYLSALVKHQVFPQPLNFQLPIPSPRCFNPPARRVNLFPLRDPVVAGGDAASVFFFVSDAGATAAGGADVRLQLQVGGQFDAQHALGLAGAGALARAKVDPLG